MIKRGRVAKDRIITEVRELTRDDLALIKEKRATLPAVQRFRDPHHRLARLFATGLRPNQVIEQSGYSNTRVMTMYADPAFKELIEHYRKMVDKSFVESTDAFFEIATSNMLKAERQIAEKLDKADEDGELLPTRDLIAISRDAADRFGYGKKQTNVNVNVDFAAQLEKAIKRSGKTIEGSVHSSAPQPLAVGTPTPLRRRA